MATGLLLGAIWTVCESIIINIFIMYFKKYILTYCGNILTQFNSTRVLLMSFIANKQEITVRCKTLILGNHILKTNRLENIPYCFPHSYFQCRISLVTDNRDRQHTVSV